MSACDDIAKEMGERFTCEPRGDYIRIRTPFLYPDGDVIDLFISTRNSDVPTVTDLGESLRWLKMQTPAARRSPKQRQLIADVCLTHGVELFKGMLTARAQLGLGDAVLRVSQAALRVADLWFTFRTRAVQSVADDVADLLDEQRIPYVRGEKNLGRSGRVWLPDFHARTASQSALVFVLSTGSRVAARGVAEHVLAAWYDLSHLNAQQIKFVSLFDDTVDVWTNEDFKLVEPLSTLCHWSKPDELVETLEAA